MPIQIIGDMKITMTQEHRRTKQIQTSYSFKTIFHPCVGSKHKTYMTNETGKSWMIWEPPKAPPHPNLDEFIKSKTPGKMGHKVASQDKRTKLASTKQLQRKY